jgi:hypothetical protein
MTEKEGATSFYSKMNRAREELLTLDWKDDKFLSLGGRSGYNYLSIDKIKRNIAPVLQRNGIELGIDYENLNMVGDPKDAMQHWTVRLEASLIDIDTGYERRYSAYGESADHGDKGVNKAQTAAMKQFLSNVFLLIDGIDPDATGGESTGSFAQKTPNEVLIAKSKILANAVKTAPKASNEGTTPEAVSQVPDAPKKAPVKDMPPKAAEPVVEPVAEPEEAPKAEPVEKTKKVPEISGLAEPTAELSPDAIVAIAENSVKDLNVSAPQKGAISNVIKVRTKLAQEGKISVMEYNTMSADYAAITDNASGAAFLKKYNVVGKYV